MVELRLLEQLTAFSEYGTLSLAAEKLHTSQPALTRGMKKLEAELGVALFVRGKNHLALNETGLHAAQAARQVLAAERDFEAKVRAFDKSLRTISIGFCAPVPQTALTPILNGVFDGLTLSADMTDDAQFLSKLESGSYQLAVVHEKPRDGRFYAKKCGHEDLYVSLMPSSPLTFYPEIRLKDLDGLSILLLQGIGFWRNMHHSKTPNAKYLLQVEFDSFQELAANSTYPVFASSYYIRRGETLHGRVNVPIVDPECHTDYYLVCLDTEKEKFRKLFDRVNETTIW